LAALTAPQGAVSFENSHPTPKYFFLTSAKFTLEKKFRNVFSEFFLPSRGVKKKHGGGMRIFRQFSCHYL
jgi:hypothetical protein